MAVTTTRVTLTEFYKQLGLESNPFDFYTTENEIEFIDKTFVTPYNYESITSNFSRGNSMIITGNRGTGKTAIMTDLNSAAISKGNSLTVIIDDFSLVQFSSSKSPDVIQYYNIIITHLVRALFVNLIGKEKLLNRLPNESKVFLSYLLQEYIDNNTKKY